MEYLYKLTNDNKQIIHSLMVSKSMNEITNRSNQWFIETFVNPVSYIPNEITTRNLLIDLDYIFSESLYLIELMESKGFVCEIKEYFEEMYNKYISSEIGYRFLVTDNRYDSNNNIMLTDEEVSDRNNNIKESTKDIINRILKENT